MAIFGRITARQRLRRATRESLTIPAFSSPVDCTPWVTGGLWPAELSTNSPETATLAGYLRDDLQRITRSANDELRKIRLAEMPEFARRAEEARVVEDARARAMRRVESAMRQLPAGKPGPPPDGADLETTQVIPVVTDASPAPREAVVDEPDDPGRIEAAVDEEEPDAPEGRHRASDAASTAPRPEPTEIIPAAARASESDDERLQRLLAFVVHQEPRLNWAIGDRPDGGTVLVTDFAHGWIPPGIALPAGVRLLEPQRRTGKAAALIGETRRARTYAPGDPLGWLDDFAETEASAQPRELPAVDDLGWELSQATHWRDGLPRMVHTLARAAAAGTGVAEEEIDLLRVHLDTARYQLLIQYPKIDPALFLNCLLLAATEGAVTGDLVSANYHLAWFHKLNEPTAEL
ncbi:vegetative cell wall protein precursor [Mycobacterium interjectum]|nr:vegetative cell wall protein precursor [Mycobacterium interjectum]